MRFFAFFVLVVAAAAGCGDSAASIPVLDGGVDAGVDPDGGGGAGGAGGVAGGEPDGGFGGAGGQFVPRCGVSALCPNCPDEDALCDTDDDCTVGSVCLATGCDDLKRCFFNGGGACTEDEDCADPTYACALEIGRCVRTVPGCESSIDCVPGFACEDNACVDRRVPCVVPDDCPHGYACRSTSADQRFCRRVTQPCDSNLDCQSLGVLCGDVEGDGQMECMPSTDPNVPDTVSCDNSQCASTDAPVCEVAPEGTRSVCGHFGLCASAQDCADGFECRDLWGDARLECVLPGGACVDSRGCATRQVCASPRSGDPPTCVGGAAM